MATLSVPFKASAKAVMDEDEQLRREAIRIVNTYPALQLALVEFARERLTGKIELNMATGGIASIQATATRYYASKKLDNPGPWNR